MEEQTSALANAYAALSRSNIHVNHVEYDKDGSPLSLEIGFQVRFAPGLTKISHAVIPWRYNPATAENTQKDFVANLDEVYRIVNAIRQGAEKF
jgi:hypothetical protein